MLLQQFIGKPIPTDGATWRNLEECAITAAQLDFQQYSSALDLDVTESAALAKTTDTVVEQLAASLGTTPEDAGLGALAERVGAAQDRFNQYLAREQAALVEGMVRAYARRRLKPLVEQYEVLEVEREGQWLLSEWTDDAGSDFPKPQELWFMSRPDALLRERESNQLYLLSLKTTGAWDIRKERDIQHDMQGLSEGVEIERRLAEWWHDIHEPSTERTKAMSSDDWNDNNPTILYLKACPAPPRILGIRYEFLLKGERWKDKDLSYQLGVECRSQRSHLIRQYHAVSTPARAKESTYSVGDVCWSWDYTRVEDQKESTLAWQNWKSRPAWEQDGGIRAWIDKLDASEEAMSAEDSTVGLEPRALGWKSSAQALGVTKQHPLDAVFVPPIVVYRNDDELRDWVEQIESQEKQIAEAVTLVSAAQDEAERRSLLNQHFQQNRHECEFSFGGTCQFAKLCWGGDDIKRAPLESGHYKLRVPNHPVEASK